MVKFGDRNAISVDKKRYMYKQNFGPENYKIKGKAIIINMYCNM